jgi:chloramphenicol 3-O phosphotransferase
MAVCSRPRSSARQGRILLLNGASSSGKSTVARSLQEGLDAPFLHLSSDQLVSAGLLPQRRDPNGPFAWWEEMRPRFFAGFHRCIPAFASAGNDLLVEYIIEFAAWRQELASLLGGLDVFLVDIHCNVDEIDRRERRRGDRRIGEGRSHVEQDRIHDLDSYDYQVDTTSGVSPHLVHTIIDAWQNRGPIRALI